MSTLATMHDMLGGVAEPDWPPLTLEEVSKILARFPELQGPFEIVSTSPRPFSAASVIQCRLDRVFVKRHNASIRDREGLLEEHRFLQHLRQNGAKVPRVLGDQSGETAIRSGHWTYEVHEVLKATDTYSEAISWTPFRSVHHAHSAGEALAKLHLAAHGFDAPGRSQHQLVASFSIFSQPDPARSMEEFIAARPALRTHSRVRECASEALRLLTPFHAELCPLLSSLKPLWTHNDLHASNLLWSSTSDDADAVAIIDFGLSDRTNAVHDLAHAIERNIVGWLDLVGDPVHPEDVPVYFDHLDALLEGYESVRPIASTEAAALAPMLALCHAEFALSEADYYLSILHSEERAPLAYDGWLVGHARWFSSLMGTKLLDWLRHWAARHAGARQ